MSCTQGKHTRECFLYKHNIYIFANVFSMTIIKKKKHKQSIARNLTRLRAVLQKYDNA